MKKAKRGSEGDSEADRLWNSLCQPAQKPTPTTPKLHRPAAHRQQPPGPSPSTPPASAQSSPASSPDLAPIPLSSPPSGPDAWDDSDVVPARRTRRRASSCGAPLAPPTPTAPSTSRPPLRTRAAPQVGPRAKARAKKASQTPSWPPHPDPASPSPPGYRKEEAEERLDSGFSEPGGSQRAKKVRFCDDVEEFFASCGEEEEDRRGPWEELARDRCRFLRRCQEVELSIAYCLQPQHRSLVYRRLTVLCTQDA
ncbi:hypothetical protein L3Q82_024484 [Scortum barcoo]|uniref:Uncharacterized protein n=1 Tax=Scortum barcoo TaxID=214431 RepID=A0ACB8WP39_9TELE|nr:hypothetical protein L3Q82_024484 [Scortum barcoo]